MTAFSEAVNQRLEMNINGFIRTMTQNTIVWEQKEQTWPGNKVRALRATKTLPTSGKAGFGHE